MDVVFGSSEMVVPLKRSSVFAMDQHEADILNFGFDFTDYDMPFDGSSVLNLLGM